MAENDNSGDWGDSTGEESSPNIQRYNPDDDQKLHILAMCFLGGVALIGVLGIFFLAYCEKEIPDVLSVAIGASVTAIAALFKVR